MINPNFMNPGMFQMNDVPSIEELWKNEKSKYRHWIILFFIAIIFIFTLLLIGLILNVTNKDSILKTLEKWIKVNGSFKQGANIDKESITWSDNFFRTTLLMTPSIKVGILFVGIVLYVSTIIDCYNKKTFAKISKWATFVVGASAFFGIYELISLWLNPNPIFSYGYGIYNFINYIIPIFVFLFISVPVNKIRREFILSEQIALFKKSPQYKQYQEQMNNPNFNNMNNNPFTNMTPPYMSPNSSPPQQNFNNQKNPENNNNIPNPNDKKTKLQNMEINDLKSIAKKMSISGYKTMKKEEIIDAILRITKK